MVMGGRAYRHYNALSNVAKLNKAGNFRGMVLSAKWRVMFHHTSHVGHYLHNLGFLASVAAGIAEAAPEIEKIVLGGNSGALKGLELSAKAGTIAQRTLLGLVPVGVHVIYKSLQGWCMMGGLAGGKAQAAAVQCVATLEYADSLVQTSFRTVTDTGNQAKAVWWVVDLVTSKK
jgi:hypothetical protein